MGLFKRLTSVFATSPASTTPINPEPKDAPARSADPRPLVNGLSREPSLNGSYTQTALLETEEELTLPDNDTDDTDFDDSFITPPVRQTSLNPIKSKQELFQELQKNYHEVVELVRKVDTHLDREQHRSARVMEVIDRIDGLIPTLERMPRELNDKADALNTQLIAAIRENAGAGTEQIIAAVDRVNAQLEGAGRSQDELVHTMASFRETIGQLAANTERSDEMLRSISDTNTKREQELAGLISRGRMTQTVVVGVSFAMGLVAVGIAVVSLVAA